MRIRARNIYLVSLKFNVIKLSYIYLLSSFEFPELLLEFVPSLDSVLRGLGRSEVFPRSAELLPEFVASLDSVLRGMGVVSWTIVNDIQLIQILCPL